MLPGSWALRVSASTVGRVLRRAGLARWSDLAPSEPVLRYEHAHPGDMVHLDTKKLGRIERMSHRVTGNRRDSVDGAGRNLLQVLIDNDRLTLLAEIRALYDELRREHEGILEAKIVSALPLDEQQRAQLVSRLEAKHKRKVSAAVEIDPRLIGGVRIVIGDKVIDATVRGRLDAMAAALAH